MFTLDQCRDILDEMVIQEELPQELIAECSDPENWGHYVDVMEKIRVHLIKQKLSKTHKWRRSFWEEELTHKKEIFVCEKCNIRCSVFDHISCLSIISKVEDDLPSYTVHNNYLMSKCHEVTECDPPTNLNHCEDCGIPPKLKTKVCKIRSAAF